MAEGICSIEGCERPAISRGWCKMHYSRRWKAGIRDDDPTMRVTTPAIERLMARIVVAPGPLDTPCWLSTYYTNGDGYAIMRVGDRTPSCHLVSYEHHVGPVPGGHELDHLCRVRRCCNWQHLEPVVHYENVMRGVDVRHRDGRSHCIQSHEFNEANTYWYGRHRQCRVCRRERARAARLAS